MDKLDRLGWAGGVSFESHGLRIGIRLNDTRVIDRIQRCIPYGAIPGPVDAVDHLYSVYVGAPARRGVRNYHKLYSGTEQLTRTFELDDVFDRLESHLGFFIAAEAPQDIFVHAGVVAWNQRVIVIPGGSMSGKTTLVAALLQAGATYYSDEYAVLDEDGNVQPFPRPLSIRQADGRRQRVDPAEFGALAARQALPVGLIVDTAYRPGASWRLRRLTPGRAMLTLLENTVCARTKTRASLSALREVALQARAVKSLRGEADQVVQLLLGYLS